MLFERDELLADLTALVERARDGEGSLALVAGEAGAGKTSLVSELVRSAGSSVVAVVGACDPLATPRPLSPLLDFASDPAAGFMDLFVGDPNPTDVFSAVLDRLKDTIRPTVMVVEDVHWADDATRDFLRFIGRRVGPTNAIVVCTYRDDELTIEHPLQVVLGQLVRLSSTHRFEVPPLSVSAIETLAGDRIIDASRVREITGGNAFYVTEIVAGGEALPPTVQDAVLARVGSLDAQARRVVEAVSIAPRSLEIEFVKPLCGAAPDAVDSALGSGVLVADGSALRFRHELARTAVETALLAPSRIEMHRTMLRLLEGSSDSARLAHHAVQAGSPELVAQYAPQAAREASTRGASREAAAFYAAALEHFDLIDPDEVARLRAAYGSDLAELGRSDESLQQLTMAAEFYRAEGDEMSDADMLRLMSRTLWRYPDPDGARRAIDRAIALLEPHGPSELLGITLVQSSSLHMLTRRRAPAADDARRAAEMGAALGSQTVKFRAGVSDACVEVGMGDSTAGLAALEMYRREAIEQGDTHHLVWVLGMLGSGGGEVRAYATGIEALEAAAALSASIDQDINTAYSYAWMARIAFEQGRWDDVAGHVAHVEAFMLDKLDVATVTADGALGRMRVRRGDPGGFDLLRRASAAGSGLELQHVWSPICGLAEHAWLGGRGEEMASILEATWDRSIATDSPWAHGEVGFWMWKAGLIDGPTAIAAEPFALQMGGDWGAAAEAWREIGCPYEVGLALADGDEAAMIEAVRTFDDLGARPAATMLRTRLKELGVDHVPRGPSRATRANPAGLTPRQLEVLGLVAAGMSNAEIADELYLSKKTVEHHVSAILTKLEVDTRARAIAVARDMGVVAT